MLRYTRIDGGKDTLGYLAMRSTFSYTGKAFSSLLIKLLRRPVAFKSGFLVASVNSRRDAQPMKCHTA